MALKLRRAEEILRGRVKLRSLEELNKKSAEVLVFDGKAGKDGKVGRDGRDGADGLGLTWRGEWDQSQSYRRNDIVRFQGATYILVADYAERERPNTSKSWSIMTDAPPQPSTTQVLGGGLNVATKYTLVTSTEYTINPTGLVYGYNIFEVDAGGDATLNIPSWVEDSKFIIVKNTMDGFNVTTQAI